VTVPRTEPCIALYPSANKNGSWVFYNLKTKTYVRRTQWTKLPTNKLVISVMNDLLGANGIRLADLGSEPEPERVAQDCDRAATVQTHEPIRAVGEMTNEEAEISLEEMHLDDVPDLVDRGDDDSVSESGDDDDDDLSETDSDSDPNDNERFQEEIEEIEGRGEELETDDTGSSAPNDLGRVQVRRTRRENAGVQRYDQNYEWNLMNLSVGAAIRNFGDAARSACKAELLQLFREKGALVPVAWESLTEEQKKKAVRSHMFLKEKYEDGKFVKLK